MPAVKKSPVALALLLGIVLGLPASAGATSSVETLPPGFVYRLSAEPQGQFTTDSSGVWYFEWGQTTAYGNQLGNFGFSPGSYTPALYLGGLQTDTVYHYRLVAREGPIGGPYDYYFGGDIEFRTLPAVAPVIGTDPPPRAYVWDSLMGANFAAGINPGAAQTSWRIEYGETQDLPLVVSMGERRSRRNGV